MAKETDLLKLRKKLQKNLFEFRKYRVSRGKQEKKATIFSKIFN